MDSQIEGALIAGALGLVGVLASQRLSGRERFKESERAERERRHEREADRQEREQARRDEFLFRALVHFGGGTQERSVGIAIAEAYWKKVPEQIDVLVPLLLNQLVYLTSVVDREKSARAVHERQNVRRIIDLLDAIDRVGDFKDAYTSSLRAIREKPDGAGIDLRPDPEIEARLSQFLQSVAQKLGRATA